MNYKEFSSELVSLQEKLRQTVLKLSLDFEITKAKKNIHGENTFNEIFKKIFEITEDPTDQDFFKNYQHLTDSLIHIMKWVHKKFEGITGSEANLEAAKIRMNMFDLEGPINYDSLFRKSIQQIKHQVSELNNVDKLKDLLTLITTISFPYKYSITINPYGWRHSPEELDEEGEKLNLVLSIEFSVDNEPWANPQVLKPQLIYKILGKLQINLWPNGYTKLILKPISTQDSSLYELILPEITDTSCRTFDINGHVLFRYPQHSFDDFSVIKLIAYFARENGEKLFPTIIGYDQLIAKALDPNMMPFITGFNAMNNEVANIANTLSKEMPALDIAEKADFLRLLSGILNYMGFCLQQGTYKGINDFKENDFRDKLIQHLIAMPYLGENIIKEMHLAGGRIEIGYKGLIAELKVEKKISDRKALIDTYCKQPVAYASGNSKQLSILCILDLTEKIKPPAHAQNNIILVTPQVHGFEGEDLKNPSKVAVVIMDGNTVNPSRYSKK